MPARIVGRDSELSAMRESIRRAKGGSAPIPLVFVGQRGMGKTVLLRELRDLGGPSTLALPLEVLPKQPLAEAVRDKLEGLIASVESIPAKAAHALDKTLKSLPKLSYELPHDAGAIALSGIDESPLRENQSLVAMLKALAAAALIAKRYVTITVDEIADADLRSMETLVRFVHESAQTGTPVLLALAGLNDSYSMLEKIADVRAAVDGVRFTFANGIGEHRGDSRADHRHKSSH